MKMEIKILSSGCANCKKLEKNVLEALKSTGIKADLSLIERVEDILSYGVSVTPALIINNKIESIGKVLTQAEIMEILNGVTA